MLKPMIAATALVALAGSSFAFAQYGVDRGFGEGHARVEQQAGKANATVYSYPGQRHAFSRHNGEHYNAAAATLANGRTGEFLNRQLR